MGRATQESQVAGPVLLSGEENRAGTVDNAFQEPDVPSN
jgi:hypothetical protein